MVEAGAGDIITVNPGEVHDGAPIGDGGRAWRMLYLDPAIIVELAADIDEGRLASAFEFTQPTVRDERMAGLFRKLFHAMTDSGENPDGFEVDEALLLFMGGLLRSKSVGGRAIPSGIASARALTTTPLHRF